MTGRRKLPRACNNGGTPTSPSSSSTTRTTMSAGENMKQTTTGNNNTEEENAMNFFKNILEERNNLRQEVLDTNAKIEAMEDESTFSFIYFHF